MREKHHPVWDVYDQLRTARLNEKYYGCRLQKFERVNFWSEILVAATASSSALAGLAFWDTQAGNSIWKVLLALAALVTISKPLLNLTKKIRSYEELLAAYRLLTHDLKNLRTDISQAQLYNRAHRARLKSINEKQRLLADKSPERIESRKLKRWCSEEVIRELPSEAFFVPEMENGRQRKRSTTAT